MAEVLDVEAVGMHDRFTASSTSAARPSVPRRSPPACKLRPASTADLLAAPNVADMTLAIVDALAVAAPEKLLRGFLAAGAGPG